MQVYQKPKAEKIDFSYLESITASDGNIITHGDMGIGYGHGGGCDHVPGHGNPHKPHP